jgi:general stress protein 26
MALKDQIFKFIGGEHIAAVATISEDRPAVRLMALIGLEDLSLIGVTMKNSRKVGQIKKNPAAQLSIWAGDRSDPYILIHCKAEVHEDLDTKKKFWDARMETYFQKPDDPNYVVLKFIPEKIEYYHDMRMDIWQR